MELQFILMIMGGVIVALIVCDSWRRVIKGRKLRSERANDAATGHAQNFAMHGSRATQERAYVEPTLEPMSAQPDDDEMIDIDSARHHFQAENPEPFPHGKPVQRDEEKKTDLIVFFILAKPGKVFNGIDLFHQFERLYLCFGDMDIFHRHKTETGEGPVLFSVASALEPGIFDYDAPEDFSTTGLTLFMQLPGHFDGGDAFETLLHTARLLAQRLDANLCDSKRQPVTADILEKYRLLSQQYV